MNNKEVTTISKTESKYIVKVVHGEAHDTVDYIFFTKDEALQFADLLSGKYNHVSVVKETVATETTIETITEEVK